MKKSKIIFYTAFIGCVTLMSCTNNSESQSDILTTDTTETVVLIEETNPHDLILVDNQKWVIDEGMRVSIDSIDMQLEAFEGMTMEEYGALSKDLSHHTKTIISSCTMKGQAHDELHKWLMPFIDLRKELDSIADPAQGHEIATELSKEIIIFKTYFE